MARRLGGTAWLAVGCVLVAAIVGLAVLSGRSEERPEIDRAVPRRSAIGAGVRTGDGTLADVSKGADRSRAATVAPRGVAREVATTTATPVEALTVGRDAALPPDRDLRIAADLPAGVAAEDLELRVWRWLGRSVARPAVSVGVRDDGDTLVAAIPGPFHRGALCVELRTRDVLWVTGVARIGNLMASRRILTLRLEPVGRLVVVVEQPVERSAKTRPGTRTDRALERAPSVRLEGVETRTEWTTYGTRHCRVDRKHEGRHEMVVDPLRCSSTFSCLPLGPVVLRTTQARSQADVRTLDIAHGVQEVVIALDPLPVAGSIEGVVRILGDGAGNAGGRVFAQHVDRPEVKFVRAIPSVPGEWRFRFEDLPEGTYRIAAFPDRAVDVSPMERRAAPPATGVDFSLNGSTPQIGLAFEVVDAATKAPIPTVDVEFPRALDVVRRKRTRGSSIVFRVPEGTEVPWRMTCEGYRPVEGDRDAFTRYETRPHRHLPDEKVDVWVANVEMVRDR
ncbi:MAG: hypothetical protein AAGI22_14345 [Planctomycetota bacterium]